MSINTQAPSLGPGQDVLIAPKKVFAKPFRLVFKKVETQEITWIEVKTLNGLKSVILRISEGELVPVNAAATLDRQLWGHLAEFMGFLRVEDSGGEFSTGIQPLGHEQAQLADDLSMIFGGVDEGLRALTEMREKATAEVISREPVEPVTDVKFVKSDGVNLTPDGEKILSAIVEETDSSPFIGNPGGASEDELNRARRERDNAEVIAHRTEVDVQEEKIKEADASYKELQTFTGPGAADVGKKIEDAARGKLDEEDED